MDNRSIWHKFVSALPDTARRAKDGKTAVDVQCLLSHRISDPKHPMKYVQVRTSNIIEHMKKYHCGEFQVIQKMLDQQSSYKAIERKILMELSQPIKQAGIQKYLTRTETPMDRHARMMATQLRFALFIARKNIAFSIIDDLEFKKYHESLDVRCPFASRRSLVRCMEAVSKCVKNIVDTKLKEATSFAITTDAWTDTAQRKYIAVTYHTVLEEQTDEENGREPHLHYLSFPRDVLLVPTSHTWYEVTNRIAEAIQVNNIKYRLVYILLSMCC